ncbi:FGGY family carbohydrate kinase [Streptomyces sp. PU-14G]|uniref:FGGY family carbohydrate kinase n=1 Tax=Streptomyces sp. PU-14G TaxID=2800808 RepID=UPI0034DE05C8
MTPPAALAGVDIGSTHCKALLCDASGTVLARAQRRTPRGGAGGHHHPAQDLLAAGLGALRDCLRSADREPDAIGVTGMAEAGAPLDRDGVPLGPVLAWSDPAPAPYAERLARRWGRAALHARTGVLPQAKVPLAKWCALSAGMPDLPVRMRHWAGAADLVAHALTGRLGTDATFAQRTMAWDPEAGAWLPDLLAEARLGPHHMPPVHAPGAPVGHVTAEAAAATGLRAGVPVVVAGHDHPVGAWACGVRGAGQVADSMGTAEAVLTVAAHPPDVAAAGAEGMSWGRHVDGRGWIVLAGMQGSGALVEWFCDRFLSAALNPHETHGSDRYAAFARLVSESGPATGEADPGPEELMVEPYLYGRSSPRPDPDATLTVHGLRPHHGAGHLARALLEGAAHHARWMTDTQATLTGVPPRRVTLLGGATRLRSWTALKAAVSPWDVAVCAEPEAAALGAAAWAGAALGGDPEALRLPCTPLTPDPEAATLHRSRHHTRFLPLVAPQRPPSAPSAPSAPSSSSASSPLLVPSPSSVPSAPPAPSPSTGPASPSPSTGPASPSASTGPASPSASTGRANPPRPALPRGPYALPQAPRAVPYDPPSDKESRFVSSPEQAVQTDRAPALTGGSLAPAALARPDGTFAMVAADQRDSLRTMMAERQGPHEGPVSDARLTDFKLATARCLGPYASALLLDADHGYRPVLDARVLPDTCAPILAVDRLDQRPGGPVEDTWLDEEADPDAARAEGTRGLKLLVIWRRDAHRERRVALAARFVELCRRAGLASVLEPVARATPEEVTAGSFVLDEAIVEAARELAPLRPSVYKCQVPGGGVGTVSALAARAARIDAVVDVPWVVLSQGVAADDFPRAVEAACRAGASGFLAGRAVWTAALDAPGPEAALRGECADRLAMLGELVAEHGRPWWEAPAAVRGSAR